MSKYTTQLRWIVEQEQGKIPASSSVRYTQATYKKIGLNEYPIFDEAYRKVLNDKIIDHFFFREIGFETCAQFAWYVRRTMNEIMPYFNKLYEAEMLITDPLTDYDHSWKESWDSDRAETGTIEDAGTGGTTTDREDHDRTVFSDTPMSMLNNTGEPQIEDMDYATSVTFDDATMHNVTDRNEIDTRTLNTNTNDAGWKVHDEKGRRTAQVELFDKLKQKYMNIDLEIINKLEDLFFGLW